MRRIPDTVRSTFSPFDRRELAHRAMVSEGALIRFLAGLPVRSLTKARIERAIIEMEAMNRAEVPQGGQATEEE